MGALDQGVAPQSKDPLKIIIALGSAEDEVLCGKYSRKNKLGDIEG